MGAALAVFLALPLVALVVTTTPTELAAGLRHPLVWPALRLSLVTSALASGVAIAFGTPLAWSLAQSRSGRVAWVEALLQLPIVIPPAVAGVALLLAFGRRGLFGPVLAQAGWQISFSTAAVVVAQVFVSAPYYVLSAAASFRQIDRRLLESAWVLGASRARAFREVALPLALPGLAAGAGMCWARGLGEFGATLMFAGNLEGTTQTLPLAIYTALETDVRVAQAMALVLVVTALVCVGWVAARTGGRRRW